MWPSNESSLKKAIAESHCRKPLQKAIAESHCRKPLSETIACSHQTRKLPNEAAGCSHWMKPLDTYTQILTHTHTHTHTRTHAHTHTHTHTHTYTHTHTSSNRKQPTARAHHFCVSQNKHTSLNNTRTCFVCVCKICNV